MTQKEDLAAYLDGLDDGRLLAQRCESCDTMQWPPRPACTLCKSFGLSWYPLPAVANLFTWTVVYRTRLEPFAGRTPYAVGVFEFADLCGRMVGFVDEDPDSLCVGEQFTWSIERRDPDRAQPTWKRTIESVHAGLPPTSAYG